MKLGIPPVDDLLAPVPEGSRILFAHDPGVEAEVFLHQIAQAQAAGGRTVVYVVTNRSPSNVLEEMADYDLRAPRDRIVLVDAFSARHGGSDPEADHRLEAPVDAEALAESLADLVPEDACLLLDDLSLVLAEGADDLTDGFPQLVEVLDRATVSASLFARWPYEQDLTPVLDRFDAIVELGGVEGRLLVTQYLKAERVDWLEDVDDRPRIYRALRPGGVYVYVPKIAVTGPFNAGKSTFIRAVSERAVSVDRLGTTVAMDHGHVRIGGVAADLFGTPGQARFDPILGTLVSRSLGLLLLVDSTKPGTFDRARELLEKTWRYGVPALVVANKQDLPSALSPEEVRRRIGTPPGVEVVGCVGREASDARYVLEQLLDRILKAEPARLEVPT